MRPTTSSSSAPSPRPAIPILAGQLDGRAAWDDARQSFTAELDVFARPGAARASGRSNYPPPVTTIGTRYAEFLTTDALVNHLIGIGLSPDQESLERLCQLGLEVADEVGEPEIVGICTAEGSRLLLLRVPSGDVVTIGPRLDHPDHRFCWGDASPATIETARAICELAWVRGPDADIDAFALALTHEFLATVGPVFSISVVAAGEWFLTDAPLTTTLGPGVMAPLVARCSAGIGTRVDRVGDPAGSVAVH